MKINLNWVPVLLWAALIFTLSSIPQIKVSQVFGWDYFAKKAAHVAEYAVLFALIFRATKGNWITAFFLTILYAASDELHQSFVPGRQATLIDLGIDASGANIAAYIIWKLKQIQKKKPKN